MPRSGLPPTFTIRLPAKPRAVEKLHDAGRWRTSPRRRGYDAAWDRLSRAFRKAHPFCRFCEQEGRDTLTDIVDHILPAHEYPNLRMAWSNLQALCSHHHDGLKQQMEHFARKHHRLDELPGWCEAIANRPRQFWPANWAPAT